MDKIAQLEKRIAELEYRLRMVEKFLDAPVGPLFHKHDQSTINAMRAEVLRDLKEDGLDASEFKKIWGTKFYRNKGF